MGSCLKSDIRVPALARSLLCCVAPGLPCTVKRIRVSPSNRTEWKRGHPRTHLEQDSVKSQQSPASDPHPCSVLGIRAEPRTRRPAPEDTTGTVLPWAQAPSPHTATRYAHPGTRSEVPARGKGGVLLGQPSLAGLLNGSALVLVC